MADSKKKREEDLVENLKALKIENDINILLLGESGVGKSTFINAIANYCKFKTFKKASDGELSILLPTRFKMYDSRTGEDHEVKVGEEIDNNETLAAGASATQNVKSYVFPILNNSASLRLIDTPGIVDTRGIHQDRVNMEAILDYLGNLHELHAICLIFKTNHTRNTAPFIYAINEILSRLEKSATNNLVFAFTNARGQDYNPGGTLECLQDIFAKIEESANKKIKIPLKDNIFCFDNEAFRYLAAVQFGKMEFPDSIKDRNIESWNRSYESFYKMIKYITQCLKPHHVKHTEAVNTARRIIVQMTKPLAEISELINHNIFVLERHQDNLSLEYDDLSDLRKNLYMPVIDIKSTDLPHPVTVCTTRKCCDVKKVGGINKQHFRAPCHEHCYLTNVEKQLVGDAGLKDCAAMNHSTGMCNKCTCSYTVHMHVYYNTELIEIKQLDENVNKTVLTKEQMVKKKRDLIAKMQEKITELKEEHKKIIKSTARFQHFLQTNAITTINDTYKQYIEYLLERENYMGRDRNEHVIKHLNELLKQYEELRKLLIESEKINQQLGEGKFITAKDIEMEKENLFRLKYNGAKLKELFNAQKRAIKAEHRDTIVTTSILGSVLESENEDNEELEEEDGDSDNSQSTVNSENNRRRRGRGNRGRGRGRGGNFNDRGQRGGRFRGKLNKDAPPPYQDHFGHAKHPNSGNMPNQSQAGPANYPNSGQFNFGGQNQNYPQNNPNQFNQGGFPQNQGGFPPNQGGFPPNQGGFPPNQGGFPSNQGGFPIQSQYFYNQNVPYNNGPFGAQSPPVNPNPSYKIEVNIPGPGNQTGPNNPINNQQPGNWNGPQGYGQNSNFNPGANNYGPNNYGPNSYDPNAYGPNNYGPNGPNNYGPNNYNSNNYAQNNAAGPSNSGGQNFGNRGDYQNRGNNDNYRGGKGRGGVQKQYNKNKFDNQKQDHKKPNQNQGAKPKQQDNHKGSGNKSGNDNKKFQGNDQKKGAGNDNKKDPGNDLKKGQANKNDNNCQKRQETVNRAPPRASAERARTESQEITPKEVMKEFNRTCRAQ